MARIRRAIISVSDKSGIVDFAKGLHRLGIEIYASGGTASLLKKNRIVVRAIEDYTEFPEMLDGRVKTLHPRIHAGILAMREKREHMKVLREHDIRPFDMVIVNLYPFEETVKSPSCSREEAIENIDIGGPTLLRGAAKNFRSVCVVVDPGDYRKVLDTLKKKNGNLDEQFLFRLAKKAFSHTAWYDASISNYLNSLANGGDRKRFPDVFTWQWDKVQDLRYGENPHQTAAFYRDGRFPAGVGFAQQLQGKELSFNNIVDIDAAFSLALEFDEPAAVIIKHTNPCGAGISRRRLSDAFKKANECDPVSAYGGIVALNRKVNEDCAREMAKIFFEAIVAPDYDRAALKVLSKKKNLRVMRVDMRSFREARQKIELKNVSGGLLVQTADEPTLDPDILKTVTKRKPTEDELSALFFAWKLCKHVKSNAIVLARKDRSVGVGAGQMSRVDSARIAIMKAQIPTRGCVVASDAFFPFRDGVDVVAEAGATAIIQPGGSIRDEEVIRAADEHDMAMVFTGIRHFKH